MEFACHATQSGYTVISHALEHCMQQPLIFRYGHGAFTSTSAVIQGSQPNRNGLRFGWLPWMTTGEDDNAPYPMLNSRICCVCYSDAPEIACCPLEVHYHSWLLHLAAFLVDGNTDGSIDDSCSW